MGGRRSTSGLGRFHGNRLGEKNSHSVNDTASEDPGDSRGSFTPAEHDLSNSDGHWRRRLKQDIQSSRRKRSNVFTFPDYVHSKAQINRPRASQVTEKKTRGPSAGEQLSHGEQVADQSAANSQSSGRQDPAWQDHPINRALAPLTDPDNPLNPASIIAESLRPPVRPDVNEQYGRAPHADPAGEMPVRPITPEDTERACEDAQAAIDTRDAFWDLWLECQDQLRSQCLRLMSGNMADAEDALSSAMLRASQKFASYSDVIANQRAWLRKLVYNVCMDQYRQGRNTEYRAFEQESDMPSSGAMFTGQQQSPEEVALTQEQMRELSKGLNDLSDNLREPLVLRCVEGWTYPDIAEELDLRADTVRKRIQLARDYLRGKNIR